MSEFLREHRLLVRTYFSCYTPHVLYFLLGCFFRWEVFVRAAAILYSAASRICSKQLVSLLCSSHHIFSGWVSLTFRKCIDTVVWPQPQLGRNPVLWYQWDQISIWWLNCEIRYIYIYIYIYIYKEKMYWRVERFVAFTKIE